MRSAGVISCVFVLTLGCGESASTCLDGDGDGYGQGETCGGSDCNDAVAEIHPGAGDVPYDGFDQDCDGRDLWDVDGDGQTKEGAPYGEATDCDDSDPRAYVGAAFNEPGLAELCRRDFDGDGYSDTSRACHLIDSREVCRGRGSDCDDANASLFPGSNANDPTCGPDLDGDGYTFLGLDCDDQNASVPMPEIFGNGVDDDCNHLSNDAPVFDWAVSIGGPGDDAIRRVSALADGVVVTGDQGGGGVTVFGTGANMVELPADPVGFVAAYGADGELRWAKAWGQGALATPVPDDSTIVIGNLTSPMTVGLGEPNERTLTPLGSDLLLGGLARDGTLLWAKTAGGPGASCSALLTAGLADGSILVAGNIHGTVTFGAGEANETTLVGGDRWDMPFLARFAADGSILWAQLAPLLGHPAAMAAKSDGTIVLLVEETITEVVQVIIDVAGLEVERSTLVRAHEDVKVYSSAIAELADGSMAISFEVQRNLPEADPEVIFQPGANEVRIAGPGRFLARYSGGTLDWVRGFPQMTLMSIAPLETSVRALVYCAGAPCVQDTIEQPGRGVGVVELDASGAVSDFHWSQLDMFPSSAGALGQSGSYFAGLFAREAVFGTDGPGPQTLNSVGGSGDAVLLRLQP